jgi:sugar transport system permease protein
VPFHLPLPVAGLAVVASGVVIGFGAGAIRACLNIPSFIVTLAMFSALRGAAMMMTDAMPIPILDERFEVWGSGTVLGLPVPAIIMLATFLVFSVVASRTTYGRSVYAIGGNAEAAHLSGIPTRLIRTSLFALTGGLAALSGILMTSRLGAGNASIGYGVEFSVITSVIVGGASLAGGKGSMMGTLLGGLFIAVLNNAMVLLGINSYAQEVANGVVVLLAVIVRTRPIG